MIRYSNTPPVRRSSNNPLKLILGLIVILVILGLVGVSYWNYLLSPVNKADDNKQAFVVAKGEATTKIVDNLYKQKLIRSPLAFQVLIKQTGAAGSIQAGDFKLSPSMSSSEILNQLQSGVVDKWVTLIEGWRVEEMAERLNKDLGIDRDEFIALAKREEGHLFPDTYLINKDMSTSDIVSLLKNTFETRYTPELQAKVKKNGLTIEQGVILASIVEREARSDEVRKNVASILLKRFKIGMGLNADATVQYILGNQHDEAGWWKRGLTMSDLKVESPYNTYLHAGFPPTPICNPSLSSLNAVANATDTPYLYYFHDSQGNSYYAKTLEEHNQNVAAHR